MFRSDERWMLSEALPLIRELGPLVRELDYHLCLGGSVLLTGASDHDLDLWFIPLNGFESDPRKIYVLCEQTFGPLKTLRDGPDYKAGEPWHLQDMQRATYLGKRIDLFIL